MKRFFAILLAVMLVASMATVASAAENTTTLTTTVPAATYTLNIPADQEIPFGATSTQIGNITVTQSTGFAVGKNLNVTFAYGEFTSEKVSTKIPYTIKGWHKTDDKTNPQWYSDGLPSGTTLTYLGTSSGSVNEQTQLEIQVYSDRGIRTVNKGFSIEIRSDDWGKALAGEYTSTITFTAEVVVEE